MQIPGPILRVVCYAALVTLSAVGLMAAPEGWTHAAPRAEVAPIFAFDPSGGPDRTGSFLIESNQRKGLIGHWSRTFAVTGGRHYRFGAQRRAVNADGRRSAVVRIRWQDEDGQRVKHDEPSFAPYRPGTFPVAEPEYPLDGAEDVDGWTEVSGVYRVPSRARRAVVELEFRWAPNARVEWANVTLAEWALPAPRTVRLGTVHFVPRGVRSPEGRRAAYIPFIEEAAQKKADLVVLGEALTWGGNAKFADVAEPIPGPSTEFFGALAKKHGLYLVAGLIERDAYLIYNVAALIGPEGEVVGKYRKVCLTGEESEGALCRVTSFPSSKPASEELA